VADGLSIRLFLLVLAGAVEHPLNAELQPRTGTRSSLPKTSLATAFLTWPFSDRALNNLSVSARVQLKVEVDVIALAHLKAHRWAHPCPLEMAAEDRQRNVHHEVLVFITYGRALLEVALQRSGR
jgi:hypothetical protein